MKKLLVVALFLGLAAVVYMKFIRSSSGVDACARVGELCGEVTNVAACTRDLEDARAALGDRVVDKAIDCIDGADSCMEAFGCMGGAMTHALDELERGFERGRR